MKKYFYFLALLVLPAIGFATITAEQEFAINRMNSVAQKHQMGTMLARTPNVVVGKYSFAVQGGAIGSVNLLSDLNNTTSTITIPDNAIVTNVFVDVLTQPVSGSSATVAQTLVSAGDLQAATAKASYTGILQGIPDTATVGDYIKLSADKLAKSTIADGVLSAGKWNVYIYYVLGD